MVSSTIPGYIIVVRTNKRLPHKFENKRKSAAFTPVKVTGQILLHIDCEMYGDFQNLTAVMDDHAFFTSTQKHVII